MRNHRKRKPVLTVPVTKVDGPFQRAIALKRGWIKSRRPGSDIRINLNDPKNSRIRELYMTHGTAWDGSGYWHILKPLAPYYHFDFKVVNGKEAIRLMGKLEALAELLREAELETAKV